MNAILITYSGTPVSEATIQRIANQFDCKINVTAMTESELAVKLMMTCGESIKPEEPIAASAVKAILEVCGNDIASSDFIMTLQTAYLQTILNPRIKDKAKIALAESVKVIAKLPPTSKITYSYSRQFGEFVRKEDFSFLIPICKNLVQYGENI